MFIATFALAVAACFPCLFKEAVAMLSTAVIAALCNGCTNSVDGACNMDVLPSSVLAGKDLGQFNLANTCGQMLCAMVSSAML